MTLPRDLTDVVAEVVSQVPRLLALQDRDPDSPMRGSLHPAYWRDKSSDVADMRRQEAALTFAWLWRHELPGNRYCGERELLRATLRAMGFWCRMQHRDGTFDEWYKNEHGYATTAFSSFAMSLAVSALGDALQDPLRQQVRDALRRSGTWLATHDDWFKTNHEAVGVAALAAVGRLLDERSFLDAARRNCGLICERMHSEGWSREISGVDVGYTFLLAEYLGMYTIITGEERFLPEIGRAYDFAVSFLHPDLTTGAEYGICGNPYFSRVATVALAPHVPSAATALEWMDRPRSGLRDTSATLKDDLRLARYAFQPLLAALLHEGLVEQRIAASSPKTKPGALLFERRDASRWCPEAKLLAVARPAYAAWAAPAHGGILRVAFRGHDEFHAPIVDRGFAIQLDPKTVLRNARYGLDTEATYTEGELRIEAPLARCAFVMPPYIARVGLRIATSLPQGHRWSRWAIDQYRRRKGTALNQSAAGVAAGRSRFHLHRKVRFADECIEIEDRLVSQEGPLRPETIFLVLDGPLRLAEGPEPDEDRRIHLRDVLPEGALRGTELILRKRLSFDYERPTLHILDS